MKRAFIGSLLLLLSLMLLLPLSACRQEENAPADYLLSSENAQTVTGQTFDHAVIIAGSDGFITFTDCVFQGSVILKGGLGARVLLYDCRFENGAACILRSSVTEATFASVLPEFVFFCEAPNVTVDQSGAVKAPANSPISFNGAVFPIEQSEQFLHEGTGETFPYTGQEATMHAVSRWTENGEPTILHTAILAAE